MAFNFLSGLAAGIILISCSKVPPAQNIVDRAISAANLDKLEYASLSFDFRHMHYTYERQSGLFEYTRIQTDSNGVEIKDVLNNEGLIRYKNDSIAQITEERRQAYSRSVNSVMYFAFLPLRLNDPAVMKSYIGLDTIKGIIYHQVEITFQKDGGGRDFEDVFYFWFDTADYSMDYFAYQYFTDGGGVRFREAFNRRTVNDVMIQDYKNFMPKSKDEPLENLSQLFEQGELDLLSVIEIKNLNVL